MMAANPEMLRALLARSGAFYSLIPQKLNTLLDDSLVIVVMNHAIILARGKTAATLRSCNARGLIGADMGVDLWGHMSGNGK